MGLVKNRRLMAMQKQQRAKAGIKLLSVKKGGGALPPHLYKSGGKSAADFPCVGGKKGMEV